MSMDNNVERTREIAIAWLESVSMPDRTTARRAVESLADYVLARIEAEKPKTKAKAKRKAKRKAKKAS